MSKHSSRPPATRASRAVAFFATATITLYYALRGGSYDIVVRQEEALAVWAVLGVGFAFGLLPRARPPRAAAVPLVALGLLTVLMLLSLAWTESEERTLAEVARTLHYLGLVLLLWTVLGRREWTAAVAGLTAASVLVCALAVASRVAPTAFPEDVTARAFMTDRLNYPFNYWNSVAAWSAVTSAMLLAWSAHAERFATRALALAATPLCAVPIYLALSRAGFVGAMLGAVAVIALGRNRWLSAIHAVGAASVCALVVAGVRGVPGLERAGGDADVAPILGVAGVGGLVLLIVVGVGAVLRAERWRMSRSWARGSLIAGAAGLLIVVGLGPVRAEVAQVWDQFRRPVYSNADDASRLTDVRGIRSALWSTALDAYRRDPIRGTGAGTFEFSWNRFGGQGFVRDAHSLYLEPLAELGLGGLLLTAGFVFGLLAAGLVARRRARSPAEDAASLAAVVGLVVFLFHAGLDWMWESTAVSVLGLGAGALALYPAFSARRPTSVPLRIGVPLLALAACAVQLPGLVSTVEVRESQRLVGAGALRPANAAASRSIEAQPWGVSGFVQRALVEEAAGQLDPALADLRRAAEREPTNWRHPFLVARVQAKRGDVDDALRSFGRAARLRPRSNFVAPSGP